MRYLGKDNAYVCYDGTDARLIEKIDYCFKQIIDKYNCEEYVIPSLIDSSVLKKCGSFESFPQHITYCSVSGNNKKEENGIEVQKSQFCLTPAACLHFYPMLEGRKIEKKCITARAMVYRYEDYKYDGISRFWNFTVREIVFIGKQEYVQNNIELLTRDILKLAKDFGLNVELKDAADSFYPTTKNIVKMKMQIKNKLKKELVTNIDGKEVALGSINIHGNRFSKTFNFDNENKVVSACIGLGLERWTSVKESRGKP